MEGRSRLESWKEISNYLKRSVKTCQRWEIELGLPVHRLDGTPRARVFADREELDRWINEKLSHLRERPSSKNGLRRKAFKAAGALALVAAAAVPARLLIWPPEIEFPDSTSCVAFLPLENASGDVKLEAWRTSLPHLISLDLVQSRVIGSWNAGDLFLTLTDLGLWQAPRIATEDIGRIGERVGCGHLATGVLNATDEGLALDLVIRDSATGEVTHSFRETCASEAGLFGLVDGLSRKIKLALGIPRRFVVNDIDEKVGEITTRSPEALHLYAEADRLVWQGKALEASRLFQKATEIDPLFAEAYYGLFRACRGTLAEDEIMRCGEKAVELSDRLNVWSRYQLRGDFYQNFKKDYGRAIAAYESLLELMDDDRAAYSLAQIYWDLEEYEKAIPLLEKAAARTKDGEHFVRLLAVCHAGRGDLGRAEKALDDYLGTHPQVSANFLHMRAVYAADQGKYEEALSFNDKLRGLYPNSPGFVRYTKAPVLITMDDFARAEREIGPIVAGAEKTQRVYASMSLMGLRLTQGRLKAAEEEAARTIALAEELGDPAWLRMSHLNKAYLDRLAGDLEGAWREVEKACPAPDAAEIYDLSTLHLKALILLDMGRTADFEKELEDIRELISRQQYPKLVRICHHLLGCRALKDNKVGEAIDEFWAALKLLPSPMGKSNADIDSARYYSSLAEAYLRADALPGAAEHFGLVPPYWEQRFNSGDVYARAFYGKAKAHDLFGERLGLTDAQKGAAKAKALESYRKFLALWAGADPLFAPELADARKRVAALEAGSD